MRRAWMAAACVLMVGVSVWAQEAEKKPAGEGEKPKAEPVKVDVTQHEQVKAAMDKEAIVTGVVESARWTATGKTFILTFKDGPEDFRLRGYGKDREALDKKFGGDAAQFLLGKKVEVTGPISKYNGSVEHWRHHTDVTVNSAEQIKVVEEK